MLLCDAAYQAGYATALADVLEYLQQNLDVQQPASTAEGTAIAQAIDYIEVGCLCMRRDGRADLDPVKRPAKKPSDCKVWRQTGKMSSRSNSTQYTDQFRGQHGAGNRLSKARFRVCGCQAGQPR